MNFFNILADALVSSLLGLWVGAADYLPRIIGALIIFVIGLIVSSGIGALVERVVDSLKVDMWLEKVGVGEYVERAGIRLDSGRFLGQVVYWFLLIAFLLATADILQLPQVSTFLRDQVLGYIPNVIAAMLIMLVAAVLGNFLRNVVTASIMSARLGSAHFLGTLVWWAVVIFGFFAALIQLGIAREIILTLITGVIAMIAIAGGIAFGLGGKDTATHLLKRFEDQVMGKK
jgi:hypothetical protein